MAKGNFARTFDIRPTANLISNYILRNAWDEREREREEAERQRLLKEKRDKEYAQTQTLTTLINQGQPEVKQVEGVQQKTFPPYATPLSKFGNQYETVKKTQEFFRPLKPLEEAILRMHNPEVSQAYDAYRERMTPKEPTKTDIYTDPNGDQYYYKQEGDKLVPDFSRPAALKKHEEYITDEKIGSKQRAVYGVPDPKGEYEFKGKKYSQIKKTSPYDIWDKTGKVDKDKLKDEVSKFADKLYKINELKRGYGQDLKKMDENVRGTINLQLQQNEMQMSNFLRKDPVLNKELNTFYDAIKVQAEEGGKDLKSYERENSELIKTEFIKMYSKKTLDGLMTPEQFFALRTWIEFKYGYIDRP